MKKRLRKKLRKGEFQELGFELAFEIPQTLGETEKFDFLDEFIAGAIVTNGLRCGGGGDARLEFFVTRSGRESAQESDRQAVEGWLHQHPFVAETRVGPLVDSWYGPFDDT